MSGNIPLITRDNILRLASQGRRIDGRAFDEIRKLAVESIDIGTAEGAVEVALGGTRVVAGVKVSVGEPFPDMPDSGVLITSAELRPIASPTFSGGYPSEEAIEIARVVDRGIRESGAIDLSKLVVEPGKRVWVINVDLHFLDYCGNPFDAGGIAAIQALRTTKLPYEMLETGERDQPLAVMDIPVPVTMVKMGGAIMADPDFEEESAADLRITVTTTEGGDICSVQKGLAGTLGEDDLEKCLEISARIGAGVRTVLKKD